MSTTTSTNNTTTNDAADATDNESVAMSISDSESAHERYQCCVCELYEWVYVSFGEDETCPWCNHAACDWCVVYERVTEQVLGAKLVE
jgi:hypothetical protein